MIMAVSVQNIAEEVLDKLRQWCQKRGIDLCILFGSRATGRIHARSDWDIAIYSRRHPNLQAELLRLYGELEDIFGHPVDLVIIHRDINPVLCLEIFQHGKLLYEAEPGLFVEQHIRAIKLHEDTEPLRRRRNQQLAEHIRWLRADVKRRKHARAEDQ